MIKLDYLAAKHAQNLVKEGDVDNMATKSLGVLQENGVYACFLYLLAKEKENMIGKKAAEHILHMLNDTTIVPPFEKFETPEDILEYVNAHISSVPLNKILLIKELLEKMLIYARYGAKAHEEPDDQETQS